jgi:chemotaxis protein CheX
VEMHLQTRPAEQAVRQLFESMLDMSISPTNVDQWTCLGPVVGIIHLTGGWDGFVLTGFEPSLAQVVAARMLAAPDLDPNDEDLRDVVGEIANILAGNLKCLIPEWTAMSIPAVIEGTVSRPMEGLSAPVNRLYFSTDYGRFWLTMVPTSVDVESEFTSDAAAECEADSAVAVSAGQADSPFD